MKRGELQKEGCVSESLQLFALYRREGSIKIKYYLTLLQFEYKNSMFVRDVSNHIIFWKWSHQSIHFLKNIPLSPLWIKHIVPSRSGPGSGHSCWPSPDIMEQALALHQDALCQCWITQDYSKSWESSARRGPVGITHSGIGCYICGTFCFLSTK